MTHDELRILQSYPLELKIEKSKLRIRELLNVYSEEELYISFSGVKIVVFYYI